MTVPSHLDIPREVQVSSAPTSSSSQEIVGNREGDRKATDEVRAVLKYNNSDGRDEIFAIAIAVHHDFSQFNDTIVVSVKQGDLEIIKKNPNVDWFEGDGKVIYCSIR